MLKFPVSRKKSGKFKIDVYINIFSYFFIGVIGIIINFIILKHYNAKVLGYFNLINATYLLLSQISVAGVHLSVQRFIPEHKDDYALRNTILSAGVLAAMIFSAIVILICYVFRFVPVMVWHDPDVETGFILIFPALFFFSLNKVLLAYLNSLRHMTAFAFFQLFRFVIMIVSLGVIIKMNTNVLNLPVIMTVSEAVVFITLFFFSLKYWTPKFGGDAFDWLKKHLKYGLKGAAGHFFLDVNTKVDILILKIFCPDSVVGIYSFASNIAVGFNQLPFVLRTAINPIITTAYFKKGPHVLNRIIHRNVKIYYRYFILLGFMVLGGYYIAMHLFNIGEKLEGSTAILAILLSGICVSAGYLPFQLIFNQLGFPLTQTTYLFLYFLINLVLNFILVPFIGMYGAATATAVAFIVQIYLLKYFVKKKISLKI